MKNNEGQPVILASSSPQRAAILEELGIPYVIRATDVEEVTCESPADTVQENARRKLLSALAFAAPGQAVIAADTVVWANGRILGKPLTAERAREFLQSLSGQSIKAFSGVAVGFGGRKEISVAYEESIVHIRPLSEELISWYVATGEPLTRAGAIGITHYGEILASAIEGSYSCVAGLPKTLIVNMLNIREADGCSRTLPSRIQPMVNN